MCESARTSSVQSDSGMTQVGMCCCLMLVGNPEHRDIQTTIKKINYIPAENNTSWQTVISTLQEPNSCEAFPIISVKQMFKSRKLQHALITRLRSRENITRKVFKNGSGVWG